MDIYSVIYYIIVAHLFVNCNTLAKKVSFSAIYIIKTAFCVRKLHTRVSLFTNIFKHLENIRAEWYNVYV